MHKSNILIYKNKLTGDILRLVKLRESNVNTFLEININNEPINIKRAWSTHKENQKFIIKGFDNLELI